MPPNPPTKHDPDDDFSDSATPEAQPPEGQGDEEEPAEFSLRQLSEAYAQVIEQQTGQRLQLDPEPDAAADEDAEEEESESASDDVACPITPESIVEAILFVGVPQGETLTSRKVASVLRDVSPSEVTRICRELNKKYEAEDSAFRIESSNGKLAMVLDPQLKDFQQEFFGRNRRARLSQAAIDIMAIVAYNQPITREQIDQVRGRPCGSVLTQLVRREILTVEPGSEDPRVRYYSTTDRFLDLFQLDDIRDLPQSHDVTDLAELAD